MRLSPLIRCCSAIGLSHGCPERTCGACRKLLPWLGCFFVAAGTIRCGLNTGSTMVAGVTIGVLLASCCPQRGVGLAHAYKVVTMEALSAYRC
jgi:hypothetical protein